MSVERTLVVGGHQGFNINNSCVHDYIDNNQVGYHGVDVASWGIVGFQKLPCVFLSQIVFFKENLIHDVIHRYGKTAYYLKYNFYDIPA